MAAKGFTRVQETAEEREAYEAIHGHAPGVYRACCDACGTRVWASGLGIGAHRRKCSAGYRR